MCVCMSSMSPDCVLCTTHTQCGSVCRPVECESAPGNGGAVDGGRVWKGRRMKRGEGWWQEDGKAPGVCRVTGLLWIR